MMKNSLLLILLTLTSCASVKNFEQLSTCAVWEESKLFGANSVDVINETAH